MAISKTFIYILIVAVIVGGGIWLLNRDVEVSDTTPTPSTDTWEEFSDSAKGITFSYPINPTNSEYFRAVDWPPVVQVLNQAFSCTETGSSNGRAGRTEGRIINGHTYCITEVVEGAAGSTYTQYAYAFPKNGKTVIFTFTIQRVQCGNYNEPKMSACASEQGSFNTDALVDNIVETFVLITVPSTNNSPPKSGPVACTMEAMICPDGSYVGRTGPNCEFTPCP